MAEASVLQQSPLEQGPSEVVGYHGCHRDVAERILAGEPWLPSANRYDWLGGGIYFWEYAPFRAREWAQQHFAAEHAVLQATLRLGRCLNFLEPAHFEGLRRSYRKSVDDLQAVGVAVPENTRLRHDLDCLVVDSYCIDFAKLFGEEVQSVRGCFPEGRPVFPGSRLLEKTHVQIAVRDAGCISEVRVVHSG